MPSHFRRMVEVWDKNIYTTTLPFINPFSGPAILKLGPKLALTKFLTWFDQEGGKDEAQRLFDDADDSLAHQKDVITKHLVSTLSAYHRLSAPIGSWHDYDAEDIAALKNITDEEASIIANWFCENYPGEAERLGSGRVIDIIYSSSRTDFDQIMTTLMTEAHRE